jgi:hypothetical protein
MEASGRGAAMTYLNPLIAPVVQGTQAQRAAAAEKERQIARAQALAKDSAAGGDRFEHSVESADELKPVGDDASKGSEQQQQQSQRRRQDGSSDPADGDDGNDGETHLDVKA